MAITAAKLIDKEHARQLATALPGRATGRLIDIGNDRAVRVSHKDGEKITGFWEAVAVTSSTTWLWWIPGQDIRGGAGDGSLLAAVDAPLHYPREWAERVAAAIGQATPRRDAYWTSPL